MIPPRRRMIDDMTLHGLKPKTIEAYVPCVARFARWFGKSPTLLGTPEIRAYLLYLTRSWHCTAGCWTPASQSNRNRGRQRRSPKALRRSRRRKCARFVAPDG